MEAHTPCFLAGKHYGSIVNVLNLNKRVPFLRFTFPQGGVQWTKVLAYVGSFSH